MNANNHNQFEMNRELNCTTGRLSNIIPQIPSPPPFATGREDEITVFRKSLPIWQKRNQITESIAANRIVLISGQTGCGKTTEVPQFILEYCNLMKKPCRIICTEPRSLLAHSVAERVSNERMEVIGQTVGYQIRLESK
jgi:HrpA-like RNA helicase